LKNVIVSISICLWFLLWNRLTRHEAEAVAVVVETGVETVVGGDK
jgi:hypothetical protein